MKKEDLHSIHRNLPQLEVEIIFTRLMALFWGRATGKSYGGIAPVLSRCAMEMPQSVGAVGCDSYRHMIGDLLPQYVKGWEALGYREDLHFYCRKYPPKDRRVPKPHVQVLMPKNAVFWGQGSALKLFGMNFNANYVGNSIDYLVLDEAKDIKEDKAKKTMLCVRGNEEFFGQQSCHGLIMIACDLPDNPEANWIFDIENSVNEAVIEKIVQINSIINEIDLQLLGDLTGRKRAYLEGELAEWSSIINELRKQTAFVSYASTLDNLHSIGLDKVKTFYKTLTKTEFQLSVLNERLTVLDKCFYPDIIESEHGYHADNNEFIQETDRDVKQDCRWDSDVNTYEALDVGFDANSALCYLAVGQIQNDIGKFLKGIFVEYPLKINDAFDKLCDYYEYHQRKEVNLYYDSTMIGEDAYKTEAETYFNIAKSTLEKRGWIVNAIYMNVPLNHKTRYQEFSNILKNKHRIKFRFNKYNCKEWLYAAKNTTWKLRYTAKGKTFEKNKVPEKSKIPAIKAQHPTDAVDSLVMGWLFYQDSSTSFIYSSSY
ncbi:MAG: hypothetical protein MUF12_08510 [Sediminibacterium sp.]|jgi:hypothetical protein|nr:hypothetical protein [Sediminibacterium sp.]